ncbi:hypothetical protein BDD12DRAFT_878274 [Trichophaea hybrida]|nr:hypothetical protein BDD12DRAFT_878274 [Trichophaea hybrida]
MSTGSIRSVQLRTLAGNNSCTNCSTVPNIPSAIAAANTLQPNPFYGSEADAEDNPFAFNPSQLRNLLDLKSLVTFQAFGGLNGLERGLRTDLTAGLSVDETVLEGRVTFEEAIGDANLEVGSTANPEPDTRSRLQTDQFYDRLRVFGNNRLPRQKATGIFRLLWNSYNVMLLLLSLFSMISWAVDWRFRNRHQDELVSVGWAEASAIIIGIAIVVVVSAGRDWQKEYLLGRLVCKNHDSTIIVTRSGKPLRIPVFGLLTGDICHFRRGDIISADGILITGYQVECDESAVTGFSNPISKSNGVDSLHDPNADPFFLSGSKVSSGVGTYLVTGVGKHSRRGTYRISLKEEFDYPPAPLQETVSILATDIAKLCAACSLLLFFILFIRYINILTEGQELPSYIKFQKFLCILITTASIMLFAAPRNLAATRTATIAFVATRLTRDNNMIRMLRACEIVGNTTTVSSNLTSMLSRSGANVIVGMFGCLKQYRDKNFAPARACADGTDQEQSLNLIRDFSDDFKDLLLKSTILNSSASEVEENGISCYIGSRTETALLCFARDRLGVTAGSLGMARQNAGPLVELIPRNPTTLSSGAVIKFRNGGYRLFVKGPSESCLARCSRIVQDPTTSNIEQPHLTELLAEQVDEINRVYCSRSLRTIALLYKDFEIWPPEDSRSEDILDHKAMTLIGILGIECPLKSRVHDAVSLCQQAGVFVRLVTGESVTTATEIAIECGILSDVNCKSPSVMEGSHFRTLSQKKLCSIVPQLQVLARASAEDKRILTETLKELKQTVAVIGNGPDDVPALETADVGFSMAISGTDAAKEASSIILMNDDFSSIVKAILWGRMLLEMVSKFIQSYATQHLPSSMYHLGVHTLGNLRESRFRLTITISAVILIFLTSATGESVFAPAQLIWLYLIMDPFAAFSLTTEHQRSIPISPRPKTSPLITPNMWKTILSQATYQLTVTLFLHFAWPRFSDTNHEQMKSFVFNTYVLMQIFNLMNARRLDSKTNLLEGIRWSSPITPTAFFLIGGQVTIILFGGSSLHVTRLSPLQWVVSLSLAAFSIPLGIFFRIFFLQGSNYTIPESWQPITTTWWISRSFFPPQRPHRRWYWRQSVVNSISRPVGGIVNPEGSGDLTAYIVYLDGVRLEAVADTGATLDVVSGEFIKRNPSAWDVTPQEQKVVGCGGQLMRTSGYVQATLRFEDSQELHKMTLHIVDGLPLDMLLSNDFLRRTETVEFKRPGAIVKAGLYPAGAANPAVALVLTNLVAAKTPSWTDRLKGCCGRRSRLNPPTREDLAAIANDMNLRAGVIDLQRISAASRGHSSVNGFESGTESDVRRTTV